MNKTQGVHIAKGNAVVKITQKKIRFPNVYIDFALILPRHKLSFENQPKKQIMHARDNFLQVTPFVSSH